MFSSEVFLHWARGLGNIQETIFFLNHLLQNRMGFNESLDTHLGNIQETISGKS